MKDQTPGGHRNSHSKTYQHPQQDRLCGHLADGRPCPIGPDGHGECRVQSLCTPWYDGTRWHCTRAKTFGGRCKEGPMPDARDPEQRASCPHQDTPCQPVRSVRSKRRLATELTVAAALGICLVIVGGSSGEFSDTAVGMSAVVSPGPLTAHHATMNQGCSACHSAAMQSPVELLSFAFGGSGSIDQSHKCLNCHREFGSHALHPHSLNPDRLLAATDTGARQHTRQQLLSRWLTSYETDQSGQLACATCHHEHQGATFDLTAMTNATCQSCHSSTFHSFADGHPDFPERSRANLQFDHVTHLTRHFQNFERLMPEGKARMQCADCHTPDSDGSIMKLASFDEMCASCHAPQIRDFDAPPSVRLHKLVFMADDRISADHGPVSPFMELMLGDPAEDPDAIDRLVDGLANDREEAVRRQLHMVCDQSTDAALIEDCVQALEESHFFDAVTALMEISPEDLDAEGVRHGNWRLMSDDTLLAYECKTHADPVLRTWIDLLARNADQYPEPPAADETGMFDRFLRDLIAPESTGRCLKCHTINSVSGQGLVVNWKTKHGRQSSQSFTHFSHKPHLTLLSSDEETRAMGSGQRCETCHSMNHDSFRLGNHLFQTDDGMPDSTETPCSALGVNPVQRRNCAQCHTQSLAGDNCLQCHNYHVHRTAETDLAP